MDIFSRSEPLFTKEGMEKLKNSHVAVFGLGGVGGNLALSLARSGVGKITLVDFDTVSESNINRQALAFLSTVGRKKTDVAEEMIKDINPDCKVIKKDVFFSEETENLFDFSEFDYVADAIDFVKSKIRLIEICKEKDVPIISSMGTGNKLCPERFMISDISKTSVCPLAKVMRTELKKRGISGVFVLWSDEEPIKTQSENKEEKPVISSNSFCPPTAGLLISSKIIKDVIKKEP